MMLRSPRKVALLTLLALLSPQLSLAQTQASASQKAILILRPHCENTSAPLDTDPVPALADFLQSGFGTCPNFSARDPETLETPTLNAGDTLDLDLIVYNPSKSPIEKVRSWISYDPQTLEGISVQLKDLPVPTPGEADFSVNEGFLKLSATSDPTVKPASWLVNVGRIQFKVLRAPRAGLTPMGFYDVQQSKQGHTYVLTTGDAGIVQTNLGSLLVLIAPDQQSSAATAVSSAGTSSVPIAEPSSSGSAGSSASSVSSSQTRTAFVLLQVQNLRATTQGGTIFAAWDKLPSSDVAGYNLYYGTERGRYIQRKALTAETNADAIRNLPENTVYYLAVRAFNAANEETAFSKEVMLKTGDPNSSTSPLVLNGSNGPTGNPLEGNLTGNVPGASGLPTLAVIVLVLCALTGTMLALRRQMRAGQKSPSRI